MLQIRSQVRKYTKDKLRDTTPIPTELLKLDKCSGDVQLTDVNDRSRDGRILGEDEGAKGSLPSSLALQTNTLSKHDCKKWHGRCLKRPCEGNFFTQRKSAKWKCSEWFGRIFKNSTSNKWHPWRGQITIHKPFDCHLPTRSFLARSTIRQPREKKSHVTLWAQNV